MARVTVLLAKPSEVQWKKEFEQNRTNYHIKYDDLREATQPTNELRKVAPTTNQTMKTFEFACFSTGA